MPLFTFFLKQLNIPHTQKGSFESEIWYPRLKCKMFLDEQIIFIFFASAVKKVDGVIKYSMLILLMLMADGS